jgi:hypothetical protein
MFELETFHDHWIIRNTENNRELKYLKSEYDREFIDELIDFLDFASMEASIEEKMEGNDNEKEIR